MKPRKPLKRSTVPIRRSRVKTVNAKRKAREFARAYGSKERVAFVRSLYCLVANTRFYNGENAYPPWGQSQCVGPTDNAHVGGGGAGRKAGAASIVPLCRAHHNSLHNLGVEYFESKYGVNLEYAAADTERLWHIHQQQQGDAS